MAIRRRKLSYPTGKPPIRTKPAKFRKIGGVKMKFTGKGRRSVGLGLHGKGKAILKRGYSGKGRRGYGTGAQGHPTSKTGASGAATPKAPEKLRIRRSR